ncbi:MAG TPA: AraC family transcriptional regulator ligand-binding domain-containing protein [Ideonella sp.]|uniref:AraC family transcriptional regulator n=1 Tax=Ideonella sp. TaxID=1929293 RepID=UPI002BA4CE70|nr:AraC family transcriptional regulator ligand-binding domain-containing protein [Ideonella sp.]HSI50797.1 AraC family transcriptional regulator ligand-binding domain-containing protein [Ideonella sp.]
MNTIPLRQLSAYRAMRDGFSRFGMDLDMLLMAAGRLRSLDEVLPLMDLADLFDMAWRAAVAHTGDPAIGLKMTPRQPMLGLGGMAHLVLAAEDVRCALQQFSRFTGVISPTTSVGLELGAERCRVTLRVSPGHQPVAQQRYDFMAATLMHGFLWVCGQQVQPTAVDHPFPAPADPSPWLEAFGAPVHFGASEFALEFPPSILSLPVPTADPSIADLSERLATRLLEQQGGSLVAQVRQVVSRLLARGDPRREQVAGALCMSERTLQRRLNEAGTSFHELVDETRRELAQRFLDSGGATPTEMSFALGFSDPSNFYRACKRWFGRGPGDYRPS